MAQSYFGFGVSAQSDRIVNISKDTLSIYGFSGAQFKQNINITLTPHINYRRTIGKRLSFQTGISYNRVRKDLRFLFQPSNGGIFGTEFVDTLKIRLSYLTVPLRLNYQITNKADNNLSAGLGINTNTLVAHEDNYQEIIPWEILLGWRRYYRVNASAQLSFFYEKKIQNNSLLNIEFKINSVVSPVVKGGWGMFKNFQPSRVLTYGVGVHYYFKN